MGRSGRGRSAIRNRGERFDGMAQDIEAGCGGYGRGQRTRVFRIHDTERGFEAAMCDACFCVERFVIEDGDARGFAAGARCGGYRNERLERARHRLAFADGRVDVIEKVGRPAGIEIRRLRGVYGGAAAYRDDGIVRSGAGRADCFLNGFIGGLDPDLVEQGVGDPVVFERLEDGSDRGLRAELRIGEDERVFRAEIDEVRTHFAGGAETEADARRRHFECVFVIRHVYSPKLHYPSDMQTPTRSTGRALLALARAGLVQSIFAQTLAQARSETPPIFEDTTCPM